MVCFFEYATTVGCDGREMISLFAWTDGEDQQGDRRTLSSYNLGRAILSVFDNCVQRRPMESSGEHVVFSIRLDVLNATSRGADYRIGWKRCDYSAVFNLAAEEGMELFHGMKHVIKKNGSKL